MGNSRRTYKGGRAETAEDVGAAVNTQSYFWVILSHHEDEAIHEAARSICHIPTDGSIDFHMLNILHAVPVTIHLNLR